jgi:hypothetical protein
MASHKASAAQSNADPGARFLGAAPEQFDFRPTTAGSRPGTAFSNAASALATQGDEEEARQDLLPPIHLCLIADSQHLVGVASVATNDALHVRLAQISDDMLFSKTMALVHGLQPEMLVLVTPQAGRAVRDAARDDLLVRLLDDYREQRERVEQKSTQLQLMPYSKLPVKDAISAIAHAYMTEDDKRRLREAQAEAQSPALGLSLSAGAAASQLAYSQAPMHDTEPSEPAAVQSVSASNVKQSYKLAIRALAAMLLHYDNVMAHRPADGSLRISWPGEDERMVCISHRTRCRFACPITHVHSLLCCAVVCR